MFKTSAQELEASTQSSVRPTCENVADNGVLGEAKAAAEMGADSPGTAVSHRVTNGIDRPVADDDETSDRIEVSMRLETLQQEVRELERRRAELDAQIAEKRSEQQALLRKVEPIRRPVSSGAKTAPPDATDTALAGHNPFSSLRVPRLRGPGQGAASSSSAKSTVQEAAEMLRRVFFSTLKHTL